MATYIETMKRPCTEDLATLPGTQDLLAPHTPHIGQPGQGLAMCICLRSDYPSVRYWTKDEWIEAETKRKDTSHLGSNTGIRGGTRCAQGENVSMTYIEEPDGRAISGRRTAEIREFARSIWRDLYSRGLAPKKWHDAPRRVQDEYAHEMERHWPVLQYCDNQWKAQYLATKTYPQWYKWYHKKMSDANDTELDEPADDSEPDEPAQKRCKTTNEGSESDPTSEAVQVLLDGDTNIATSSWLENDVQEGPTVGTSRPRARPLKDPLYVPPDLIEFTNILPLAAQMYSLATKTNAQTSAFYALHKMLQQLTPPQPHAWKNRLSGLLQFTLPHTHSHRRRARESLQRQCLFPHSHRCRAQESLQRQRLFPQSHRRRAWESPQWQHLFSHSRQRRAREFLMWQRLLALTPSTRHPRPKNIPMCYPPLHLSQTRR